MIGNFRSQDSDMFLFSFCADSSSPQISAILVGHFTGGGANGGLRKCPRFSATHPKEMRNKISKSWLVKFPRDQYQFSLFAQSLVLCICFVRLVALSCLPTGDQ